MRMSRVNTMSTKQPTTHHSSLRLHVAAADTLDADLLAAAGSPDAGRNNLARVRPGNRNRLLGVDGCSPRRNDLPEVGLT